MNLISLGPNIWTAVQSLDFFGLEVGNRMTVVCLESGTLVLISPIRMTREDCQLLDDLGVVGHIVVPNLLLHDLHAQATQELYPKAKLWGVDGLNEKRPELETYGLLNYSGVFENDLEYLPFEGLKTALPHREGKHIKGIDIIEINETVFFHRPSSTFILTDVAFNFDEDNALKTQIVARLLGCYKNLRPSWGGKMLSTDKKSVEDSVRKVLAWDFEQVVPAHGGIVEENAKGKFRTSYEWFLGKSL